MGSLTITSQQECVCVCVCVCTNVCIYVTRTFPDFQSLNKWRIPSYILSMKAKKICKSVIPVLEPTQDGWWFGCRRAWFCGHVLLPSDAEVTPDRTAAHGTSVQLAKTTGTDAGMPTWKESSWQREILANNTQLFSCSIPHRATVFVRGRSAQQRCWPPSSHSPILTGAAMFLDPKWHWWFIFISQGIPCG